MKTAKKVAIAVVIVIFVTGLWYYFGRNWLPSLYAFLLAIFPQEIKNALKKVLDVLIPSKQLRVSFAYLFRIQDSNLYLLVKDEQGRNSYHPVGGVYKYDPRKINIADRFAGIYDGLFDLNADTEQDLRLKISRKKFKDFMEWFKTESGRENSSNLSREFVEELIDKQILPDKCFRCLSYKYIGSVMRRSKNERLKMPQVHHFDIFELQLTTEQVRQIDDLRSRPNNASNGYVFATEEDIERGTITFAGNVYEIADTSQYILVSHADSLNEEFHLPKEIQVHTKDAFQVRDVETDSPEKDMDVTTHLSTDKRN